MNTFMRFYVRKKDGTKEYVGHYFFSDKKIDKMNEGYKNGENK